jgi:hypothetical protein
MDSDTSGSDGVTHLIIKVPNCHTNTTVMLHASRDGVVVVSSLLGVSTRRSLASSIDKADVELRKDNVEVKRSESGHLLQQSRGGWGSADLEVRLETNTIDLDLVGLEGGDGVERGGTTGTSSLDTVVVVVELDGSLGLGDGLLGGLEGDGEEGGADDLVEGVCRCC